MNDNWGLSDEELDGLFRQAADGQRPRFDPEDWRQMAARLDAAPNGTAAPRVKPGWLRSWWLLVGLLLFTGAGLTWWVGARNSGKTNGQMARVATEKTARNEPPAAALPVPARVGTAPRPLALPNGKPGESGNGGVAKTNAGATAPAGAEPRGVTTGDRPTAAQPADRRAHNETPAEHRVESSIPANKNQLTTRPTRAADAPKSNVKKARNTTPGLRASAAGIPSEGTTLPIVVSARSGGRARSWEPAGGLKRGDGRANPAKTRPGSDPKVSRLGESDRSGVRTAQGVGAGRVPPAQPGGADEVTSAPPAGAVAGQERAVFAVSALKPRAVFPKKRPAPTWPDALEAPADTLERRVTLPPVPRGRFGLRVVLSPDLNSVSVLKPSAFGYSYGLLAEYEFLPRWRVQAGVIRSQKNYGSVPKDYQVEAGYWATYGYPDAIDAKCAILDLPLNVRFDAIRRPRHDLFVSGGISSYLMRNEDYLFYYSAKPWYVHPINVWRGSNHFASTLNLSVGYERQWGGGLSLQLEPYLQLPLTGVGYGKVRIYSLGLHVSLGFHPTGRSPVGR